MTNADKGVWSVFQWYECREVFHKNSQNLRRMCFSHSARHGTFIASFLDQIEDKLGVPKSIFGPTKRPTITWLRPSSWWMNSSLKRSLFTALLRAADNYNGQNFDDALWSNRYLYDTKYAVMRFLDGYTRFQGRGGLLTGWYNTFYVGKGNSCYSPRPLKQIEVDKLLVRPK